MKASLSADPELDKIAHRIFLFSDFVANSCTRDPKLLRDLVESGDLKSRYRPETYRRKLEKSLAAIKGDVQLEEDLRRLRRREMVRIAWRDLAGWVDLSETFNDLSAFADACIDQTLTLLYNWQCAAQGIPIGIDGSRQQLVVIGMGKLGGKELNFSSDVDLIFTYPEIGETKGGIKRLSNEDFFVRLCRRLIKVLGRTTVDGFVFRIDTRLRPYGESGPLVMNFDAMERYYQREGREWERYAWIKARVVAGDKVAGQRLLKRLNPFVYRRYLDFGAFESLRNMKEKISIEVQRKGLKNNIKLGSGGIREVEFFGQVFQLIRGGVTQSLQERSIQKALGALARENYIPRKVSEELCNAYEMLRTVENRLQEFSDQQTHQLPSKRMEKKRLALSMNFEDPETFTSHLDDHRRRVHTHFRMLLETNDSDQHNELREKALEAIWFGLFEEQEARRHLSAVGFNSPEQVLALLDNLRQDTAMRMLGIEGRRRLDKLIPLLLIAIGTSENPLVTFTRIIDLIKAIEGRAAYLALLLENPTSLRHLVKLTEASSLIASFLARHPVLLDELLDPRTLYLPPQRRELEDDLRRRMDHLSDDFEYQVEELRVFKQVSVFRVAAADVTEVLPLMRVSDHLSDIAEIVLNEVFRLAWRHLTEKHGTPTCILNGQRCDRGFVVIAYGKLGGLELGYGSDLDLVFLHSAADGHTQNGKTVIDNRQFFARLGQRVIHILTVPTRAGVLYETDMRLRPSGEAGILVSHIESFREYQKNDAWTWEHQALIRARAVGGDPLLNRRFEVIRKEVLGQARNKSKLQRDVAEMRKRLRSEQLRPESGVFDLKHDTGGIVDIEFLVQYLVLLKSYENKELLKWTDNVRLIQTLLETGVFDEWTAHLLKHAYLIYRATAHKLSLQEKPAKVSVDKFHYLREKVEGIWLRFLSD
ncbi:MAG: bifunctional [glutamate--ammonia ligase]-adenylyl-L-tyrosine phosphorylase/[glutamate--ammonia-ligase] adenylyltransferase [Deltaproteobacteria bacterium]|nr:MAG: bifunctional [glutamate--ammonia ligase]-adenylyl-L-tyrosine phosphorylase/[glutamate--ammonia-ligase] adenylyltransferase [Deltaproteobacteria bacterium]